ncbi:hotdog family protein [Pollutimonas bauzanensis]|jgi:predicted hotdog family 3-hydroxylacyl-ACP dehydratase|uniref:hotdog family protein n=1 Tax=Pollutimonas bauzanensis TaxID=658167 RepID=UPI0033415542
MNLPPVAQLIPHSGNVILIDEIVSFDKDTLVARAQIKQSGLFNQADGSLPAWLGLEIMAQAVAAWAGCTAFSAGQPVKLGFLLGTRRYDCQVPAFVAGSDLTISVACSLQDDAGIGTFDCQLHQSGHVVASARLNAYSPPNVDDFIQEPPPNV